jgi:hypothetical protein
MVVSTADQVANLIVGGRTLTRSEYIAKVDDMLVTNVTQALEKLGARLAIKLSENVPVSSGELAGSFSLIGVKETDTGYRIEIKVDSDHYDYIDKGVRGIQNKRKTYPNAEGNFYQFKTYGMPPEALQKLEGWAARKNIELQATGLIEGRTNLPQISSPASRLAYYIKKYGIEGRQYIKKSIDEVTSDIDVDVRSIARNTLILKVSK